MKSASEYCPKNKSEWRQWLESNHESEEAIWLVFFKKKSPRFNLSWSESVDEALCFGWIDSTKRTIDEERYKQYFTKRKANSNWSKINKEKIKKLTKDGLMHEAGLRSIAIAKENGSWTLLDSVEALVIPDDLDTLLSQKKVAFEFFQNLSKSDKKSLLYWVASAKRTATRKNRINEIVSCACKEQKPAQFQ